MWHFQKDLLKIIIQPVVISVINRYITCNITKCCYKNFKRTTAGSCIGKMMPFSNMTDMQLNRLMKERYVISPTNDDLVSFILNCRKRPRYRNIWVLPKSKPAKSIKHFSTKLYLLVHFNGIFKRRNIDL